MHSLRMPPFPVKPGTLPPPDPPPAALTPPVYVATCGARVLERANRLADLIAQLEVGFEPGWGEDVAVWEGNRLLFVWTAEGKSLAIAPRSGAV
jgi:hypothetical protein